MIELDEFFIGKGETLGFEFTQLFKSNKAYMYEVFCPDINERHYEAFKRKESKINTYKVQGEVIFTFPPKVIYPNSNNMGKWAWCFKEYEKALEMYNKLNS